MKGVPWCHLDFHLLVGELTSRRTGSITHGEVSHTFFFARGGSNVELRWERTGRSPPTHFMKELENHLV
jgi:hypothetical protein